MNPDAQPYDCPTCGKHTKVNTRTGLLYSHTRPGTSDLCPDSAKEVITGTGGKAWIDSIVPATAPKPRPSTKHRPRGDEPSTSVRAIPSGLPTLGKRR